MQVCISLDYIGRCTYILEKLVASSCTIIPISSLLAHSCLHFGEEGSVFFYLIVSVVKSRISTCAEHIMFRAMSVNYLISKAPFFLQGAFVCVLFLVTYPVSVRAFEDGF
jgi:hypothetical protein